MPQDGTTFTDPTAYKAGRLGDDTLDAVPNGAFVPQGGGPPDGHRCAGEALIQLLIPASFGWFTLNKLAYPEHPRRRWSRAAADRLARANHEAGKRIVQPPLSGTEEASRFRLSAQLAKLGQRSSKRIYARCRGGRVRPGPLIDLARSCLDLSFLRSRILVVVCFVDSLAKSATNPGLNVSFGDQSDGRIIHIGRQLRPAVSNQSVVSVGDDNEESLGVYGVTFSAGL
jgi:hypothetical protein